MAEDFLYFDQFSCEHAQHQLETYGEIAKRKHTEAFGDIDAEARQLSGEWLSKIPFDPEFDDPGTGFEMAYDYHIDVGLELQEVADASFAFITVGFHHLFEKQLVAFLQREMRRSGHLPHFQDWKDIENCLRYYRIELKALPIHTDLKELRLLANVIKHGIGHSHTELKNINPRLFRPPGFDSEPEIDFGSSNLDFSLLGIPIYITGQDFDRYLAAILFFWDHDRWCEIGERWPRIA